MHNYIDCTIQYDFLCDTPSLFFRHEIISLILVMDASTLPSDTISINSFISKSVGKSTILRFQRLQEVECFLPCIFPHVQSQKSFNPLPSQPTQPTPFPATLPYLALRMVQYCVTLTLYYLSIYNSGYTTQQYEARQFPLCPNHM